MNEYLKIQSKGEIEIEAFTLIGASSKRNDETKIGYFGSGLKYSIASMLRNNIDFKIFQGETEIKFDVVDKIFRNENYKAISVNGQETSMTTTMGGSDWDIPFAPFREIYSNALDEDDSIILQKTNTIIGEIGTTSIYIEKTPAIADFYSNFNEYFCDKNPNVLATNIHGTIYPQTSNGNLKLFRKGILCYDKEQKSVYSYNSNYEINESRVLKNESLASYLTAKCLKSVTNSEVIKSLLNCLQGGNAGYYEHTLPYSTYVSFSDTWHEVCINKKFVPAELVTFCKPSQLVGRIILPKSLLQPLYRQFQDLDVLGLSDENSDSGFIYDDEPSQILLDKVVDAIAILNKTRYKSRMNNLNIVYATFSDNKILGRALNGEIILSNKLVDDDVPYIAKIIIEENEHLKSGFEDETRDFQNHLFKIYFDELIS
jgi:hypothetical protein